MAIYVHLWCLAQFFLEWEMFQTEVAEKKHAIYVQFPPPWKSCRLWDNVEKNIVEPDRPQMTI